MSYFKPHDYEMITLTGVSSAVNVTSLTTSKFTNETFVAFITVESAAVRCLYTGDAPTTDVGHLLNNGDNMTLYGLNEILNFRSCPDTTVSATLWVTYSNSR